MSITSLAVVPGTLTEKPNTLSLNPSTIACRWRAIPKPDRYFDSASPSALLICRIFSASAFSVAANLSLAAAKQLSQTSSIKWVTFWFRSNWVDPKQLYPNILVIYKKTTV
ncbi:hypothetical protein Hanom_Chr08g00736181 [Helianthus anomalus]